MASGFATSPFARPGKYFVPDLSPQAHPELKGFVPRLIFVAESPHLSEIAPAEREARRPLCGKAGLQWWGMLRELEGDGGGTDVSLESLTRFCSKRGFAVMNALQYPLDPKITAVFPDADPSRTIGFSKAPGPCYYKKMKERPQVQHALQSLRLRLTHPSVAHCLIHCLGLDAEWFVAQALGKEEYVSRVRERIPHPSAWWRQGGKFGRIAREKLAEIL